MYVINYFLILSQELKSLKLTFLHRNTIFIVVTHCLQVSDIFTSNSGVQSSKYRLLPSLGLIWSNLITTRILLSKTNESVTIKGLLTELLVL